MERLRGVIVFPTETVYGIGCDALDRDVIRRVLDIKKRTLNKPLPVLISDTKQLDDLVKEMPPLAEDLIKAFWPGPLTIVFKAKDTLPEEVTAGSGSVGVRMPDHPVCLEIIKAVGGPIIAPSANLSGKTPPAAFSEIDRSIIQASDFALDAGRCQYGIPSTVVDVREEKPVIIREGTISSGVIARSSARQGDEAIS